MWEGYCVPLSASRCSGKSEKTDTETDRERFDGNDRLCWVEVPSWSLISISDTSFPFERVLNGAKVLVFLKMRIRLGHNPSLSVNEDDGKAPLDFSSRPTRAVSVHSGIWTGNSEGNLGIHDIFAPSNHVVQFKYDEVAFPWRLLSLGSFVIIGKTSKSKSWGPDCWSWPGQEKRLCILPKWITLEFHEGSESTPAWAK